jgi:hypothetical protein
MFDFFSRTIEQILTKQAQIILRGGFKFVQMKGNAPHQGEIIAKE